MATAVTCVTTAAALPSIRWECGVPPPPNKEEPDDPFTSDGLVSADVEPYRVPIPPGTAVDPRFDELAWIALRVAAADPASIVDAMDVGDALRALADVLEQTWDPGRTAAISRIETICDRAGRPRLELALGVGVLGSGGDSIRDAADCVEIVQAAFNRYPAAFSLERIDARGLLENWPLHTVAIRQSWVEVEDAEQSAAVPLRFDRGLESWLELADLLLAQRRRVVLQTMFAAATLRPDQVVALEDAAAAASAIQERALEAQDSLLAQRAARVSTTIIDFAESYSGTLWSGEVLLGADEPLGTQFARAVGAAISNPTDVIHRQAAPSPLVAARVRLIGGFEVERVPHTALRHVGTGLARPTLEGPTLADCFSITEAALCFRWPVPAGRSIPTIDVGRHRTLAPASDLPDVGFRIGVDELDMPVHFGDRWPDGHTWLLGATGTGKTTVIQNVARHCLASGVPFVVLDPHGDLTRAIREAARELRRSVAVVDADEPKTDSIDLLGGVTHGRASQADVERAIGRLIDAMTSHLPRDWTGPRFRQLARAALEVVVAAARTRPTGLADVARLFADGEYLQELLLDVDECHGSRVLRQYLSEQDRAGVGLWVASKFEDIAFSPGASRIIAPFGSGTTVGRLVEAGTPLVVNLSSVRLTRLASRILGHVLLASAVDHALGRPAGDRTPFHVFADEAQRLPAVNLVDALSESRKYGLRLFVANQQTAQLDTELCDALLANAGTRIVTRVGLADAHVLGRAASIPPETLASLPNHTAVVQLDGGRPFSVRLDPPHRTTPRRRRPMRTVAARDDAASQLQLDLLGVTKLERARRGP